MAASDSSNEHSAFSYPLQQSSSAAGSTSTTASQHAAHDSALSVGSSSATTTSPEAAAKIADLESEVSFLADKAAAACKVPVVHISCRGEGSRRLAAGRFQGDMLIGVSIHSPTLRRLRKRDPRLAGSTPATEAARGSRRFQRQRQCHQHSRRRQRLTTHSH